MNIKLNLNTKISVNPILQLCVASDTSMSVERLLIARLVVAAISLYITRPSPQTLRVKSPSDITQMQTLVDKHFFL